MKLSIIIPVFNEEKTIKHILERVENVSLKNVEKEIIIVDDGSTDQTPKIIKEIAKKNTHIFIRHKKNSGKGSAIQSGFHKATGDYILIQDADLEYDPSYIPSLLIPILKKKARVVYGTRLNRLPNITREERTLQFFIHYFGNRFLSFMVSILYGAWLTDIETGYKMIPKEFLNEMTILSKGFDIEAEITVKLLKKGYSISEVPIQANPRGYNEGKKLQTIPEGLRALKIILTYKLFD
jgi:dolichol-phosphate mannosyltransferase